VKTVAIVGAGIAGLTCAQTLASAKWAVTVFNKSRHAGGRCATRRTEVGNFDHGAQNFNARSERFKAQVNQWESAGMVARWHRRHCHEDAAGQRKISQPSAPRYVFVPGMSTVGHALTLGSYPTMRYLPGIAVVAVERQGKTWWLTDNTGHRHGGFDTLVLALPGLPAAALLEPVKSQTSLAPTLLGVHYTPSWAVMVAFNAPLACGFDSYSSDTQPIIWAQREGSKPGRSSGERWVVQASAAWSQAHLQDPPEQVQPALLDLFARLTGDSRKPIWSSAHRWRYAFAERATQPQVETLWDMPMGLGVCGDAVCESRVEAVWASGQALATSMMLGAI
jgi:predicted NAD/FAD-dependent oxidoreductase